nr:MAG TPA: RuvC [Bacteriophage sp.]
MRILALDQARHGGWSVFEMDTRALVAYGAFNFDDKQYEFDEVLYQVVLLIHKLMCQYDCAALFIEDIQMQTNVQGFKRLAQLHGAILYYCAEHEILVSAVTPSQWQNYCKARGRTSKEVKSGILSLEDSGKKRSKMLSLQYVRDTYGVETTNDNVSDAICIGTYVVNNIKIRTKR